MNRHKKLTRGLLLASFFSGLLPCLMPASAEAAVLVVTSTSDAGVGGCTPAGTGDGCTLREAILAANNPTLTPGADTINASGVRGTINLVTALPALSTTITLVGPGPGNLTVQRSFGGGTPEFRIFTVDNTTTSGPTVVLSGLKLINGKVSGTNLKVSSGGAIYNNHGTLSLINMEMRGNSAAFGGAVANDGSLSVSASLSLTNSILSANTAINGGGALYNNGSGGGSAPLTLSGCTLSGNKASNGGAILNDGHAGGSATITQLDRCSLNSNVAYSNGGAIQNNGTTGGSATLVMSFSTMNANRAANGGAINNAGVSGSATLALSNSTFSSNYASTNGGAINNDGRRAGSATLALTNSTFSKNSAGARGGAVLNVGTGGSSTVAMDSSTLHSNSAASSNSATIDSDGTAGSATLALGSTILSNSPGKNVILTVNSETTFTSKNYNLCSDAAGGNSTSAPGGPYFSAGGDIRNTFPLLDPQGLKDNGGLTKTLALQPTSPAINKGDIGQVASNTVYDQRGPAFQRVVGGRLDIGAFESGANLAPQNVSLSPNNIFSNNAVAQSLTATYSDGNGQADIRDSAILVNSTLTMSNALFASYNAVNNKLYLRNDAHSAWIGGFTPGSSNIIRNSQGSLNCATTSVTRSGNNVVVKWTLTPFLPMLGTKNVYLRTVDRSNLGSAWTDFGNWTISRAPAASESEEGEVPTVTDPSANAF